MYLLDLLHTRLSGDKLVLARQLMYRPWTCDLDLLAKHVQGSQFASFRKMRQYCGGIVASTGSPRRSLRLRLRYVAMHAYVVAAPGDFQRADIRAVEMREAFVGQAIEDLDSVGLSFRALSLDDQAALVSLYAQAWCCLWCLAGVYLPFARQLTFLLADDQETREALRLYWFGHHWSFQSGISDLKLRELAVNQLRSSGAWLEHAVRARAPAFQLFVTNTLDKYVSFHEDFSPLLEQKDKAHYESMYRRAALICYFYLKSYDDFKTLSVDQKLFGQNVSLPHDYPIAAVRAAGFSDDELEALLEESKKKGEGEAFILRSGQDTVRLGLLGMKYAIVSYLKPMLVAMQARGRWFDSKYIPAYLKKRVGGRRFRFGPEIKARSDKEGWYDVDLVVADEQLGRLYFCQVKHRMVTLLPHFRDEFTEYTRAKLDYAVDQLKGTAVQFGNQSFLQKVLRSLEKAGVSPAFLARIDLAFLERNTGYIVIHTIENLDFAVKDGVALYEWNTFRNLLRGSISVFSKDGATVMSPDLRSLALDDPNNLSRALTAWSATHGEDNPLHPDKQWFYAVNSRLDIQESWCIQAWNRSLGSLRGARLNFPII